MKNDILKRFLIYLAIFMVVVPVAKYFAHRNAQELWQQEQTKSKRMKPYTANVKTQVNGQTLNMNVRTSETDNSVRYNINGKIIDMDKNIVFGEECKKANAGIENMLYTTNGTTLLRTFLLYSYKFMVVSYCDSEDMTEYIKKFDATFGASYKDSLSALNSFADNKAEKCVIKPMVEARASYLHEEVDGLFRETKISMAEHSNNRTILTKTEFCKMINTDEDMQNALFDIYKENIATVNKSSVSVLPK